VFVSGATCPTICCILLGEQRLRSRQLGRSIITIGMPVSLSGRYALQGSQCRAGLECYAAGVNGAGGIFVRESGRRVPVELRIRDDRSHGPIARAVTEELIREKVDLLFGPYGSGITAEVAKVAERHQHILWNHSGAGGPPAADSPWLVSVLTPAPRYFRSLLDLFKTRDPGLHRVMLLHATTGFATAVAGGVLEWAEREGISLATHAYHSGTEDLATHLRDVVREPSDVLLGVGRIEDDLRLAGAILALRPSVKAAGLVAAGIARFQQELGTDAEGFLAPTQWEAAARYRVDCGPPAEEFEHRYGAMATVPLDYPAAQAYAAGVVAQRCVEEAGSLDQAALRAAAARCRVTTFYGDFAIDPATGRQNGHSMLVVQWQRARKVIVWPPQFAEADPVYPGPFWR
jgi:branched-chain amino acid transport system substrate-binding protein